MTEQVQVEGPLFGAEGERYLELPWWLTEPPRKRKKSRFVGAISPSKIRLAQQCLRKWHYRYRERRYEPSGPAAMIGKLVHGAYEDAAQRRLHPQRGQDRIPRVASVDELKFLLEHQEAQLAAEGDLDCSVTAEMYAEAMEIVVTRGSIDFSNAVGAEDHVKTFLPGKRWKVGGKIDRLDLMGGTIERPDTVVVVDYKTDREEWSRDKLYGDPQPAVYLMWAHWKFPMAKAWVFCLDLVRLGKKQWVEWSPSYEARMAGLISSRVNLFQSGADKPTVGDHCRWCSYRDGDQYNAPCRAYQEFVASNSNLEEQPGGLGALSFDDQLRLYRTSKAAEALHATRKSDLKELIVPKLGKLKRAETGLYQARCWAGSRTTYHGIAKLVRGLAEISGREESDVAGDLCSVSPTRLNQFLASLNEAQLGMAKTLLAKHETKTTNSPTLKVERKKLPWEQ